MKILTGTVFILITSLIACKTPSKTLESTASKTEVTTKETVYDIIISFISKASGIDDALKTKVDTALSEFNKKHNTKIQPEIVTWGREGEKDYLILTKNLSTKQKKEIIAKFKIAIDSSDMAHIFLTKKSVHKR